MILATINTSGQAGADNGETSYLHIAYATNSTGTAGFDVSNATVNLISDKIRTLPPMIAQTLAIYAGP
ncbi:hypothetical protein [Lactococcus lactis]